MTKNTTLETEGHIPLFISFTLVDDTMFKVEREILDGCFVELFPDEYILDHVDPEGLPEREVVYKLSIDESVDLKSFFEKLNDLFLITRRYLPAFSQGASETE